MWAFDDFTEANGATRIVPGSHRRAEPGFALDQPTVPLEMPAGSAVFYPGTVVHGGGANTTDAPRLGVILEFSAGWVRPQENHLLGVPKAVVRTLPERLQELLGYDVYPPVPGQRRRPPPPQVPRRPVSRRGGHTGVCWCTARCHAPSSSTYGAVEQGRVLVVVADRGGAVGHHRAVVGEVDDPLVGQLERRPRRAAHRVDDLGPVVDHQAAREQHEDVLGQHVVVERSRRAIGRERRPRLPLELHQIIVSGHGSSIGRGRRTFPLRAGTMPGPWTDQAAVLRPTAGRTRTTGSRTSADARGRRPDRWTTPFHA